MMTARCITSLDDRHLSAESWMASSPADLLAETYDYMLVGSSWDRRCLRISEAHIAIDTCQLFLPRNKGTTGRRSEHDRALVEYCRSVARTIDVIEDGSEELDGVFLRIEETVLALRKQLDRPIRMLIDLSAMARYFSLGAV